MLPIKEGTIELSRKMRNNPGSRLEQSPPKYSVRRPKKPSAWLLFFTWIINTEAFKNGLEKITCYINNGVDSHLMITINHPSRENG